MQDNSSLLITIVVIVLFFAAIIAFLWSRNSKLADEVDSAENDRDAVRERARQLQEQVRQHQEKILALEAENKKTLGWLDTTEQHLKAREEELKARPKVERIVYRILTVGMKATGKSSLTLKWANPLVDLGTIEGTKMERYERTVSLVKGRETYTEHVFELYDWGGEHIVDAQAQLVRGEIDGRKGDIHGILMVVDLGGRDARQVDEHRIQQQIDMFNQHALQFFLTTDIVRSCKTIVLFINKSDLIPGPPAHAEAHAQEYFYPLIQALQAHSKKLDVRVMVGSASFGHSTHILFAHFVQLILPDSAYDQQLVRGIKGTEPRRRTQTMTPEIHGELRAVQALPAPAPTHPPPGPPRGGHAPPAPANASVGGHAPPAPPAPPRAVPQPGRQGTVKVGPSNEELFERTVPYKPGNPPFPPRKA
ncbi:MAG TPA: hypothetical protein PKA58_14725 [Polyangium sp.]|nr:hypothetical protein [Polyangium sp.]